MINFPAKSKSTTRLFGLLGKQRGQQKKSRAADTTSQTTSDSGSSSSSDGDGSERTNYSSKSDSVLHKFSKAVKKQCRSSKQPKADKSAKSSGYTTSNVLTDTFLKAGVVREWYTCLNNHDMEGALQLITFEFRIVFHQEASSQKMTWFEYYTECQNLFAACPDYKIARASMEAKDDVAQSKGNDAVVVMVLGVSSSGTHTGKDYAFGNDSDPIVASGNKHVKTDPATVHFHFQQNQICKIEVRCSKDGAVAGPAGIYTKLGGFPPV